MAPAIMFGNAACPDAPVEGLEVDAARMRSNLDTAHGLIMAEAVTFALAEKLGKSEAHHLVEEASKTAAAAKKASARCAGRRSEAHRTTQH
jgi:adenylosuccinate lyase